MKIRRVSAVSAGAVIFLSIQQWVPLPEVTRLYLGTVVLGVVVSCVAWEYVSGLSTFSMGLALGVWSQLNPTTVHLETLAAELLLLVGAILLGYIAGWLADLNIVYRYRYAAHPEDRPPRKVVPASEIWKVNLPCLVICASSALGISALAPVLGAVPSVILSCSGGVLVGRWFFPVRSTLWVSLGPLLGSVMLLGRSGPEAQALIEILRLLTPAGFSGWATVSCILSYWLVKAVPRDAS